MFERQKKIIHFLEIIKSGGFGRLIFLLSRTSIKFHSAAGRFLEIRVTRFPKIAILYDSRLFSGEMTTLLLGEVNSFIPGGRPAVSLLVSDLTQMTNYLMSSSLSPFK